MPGNKILSSNELLLFTNLQNNFKKRMQNKRENWLKDKRNDLYNIYNQYWTDISFDEFLSASYLASCTIRESWYYSK